MKAILVAIGSSGDVHPLVGVGLELRRRGHEVTVVASAHFQHVVENAGLTFVALGTEEDYEAVTSSPDLSHPIKGSKLVIDYCCVRPMQEVYEYIAEVNRPGETVVVAGGLGIGARIAQEKLGVPLITTFLQPLMFRSVHDTARFAWLPMPSWTPSVVKRMAFRAIDLYVDRLAAPEINAFRAELDLPPVSRVLDQWWMSPELVIGLFPSWFAAIQPDWPSQVRLTGFPLYDESDTSEISVEAKEFLDAGSAPIVFTPGSAMRSGLRFFEVSAEACRRLGRRGILLSRFLDQIPKNLPDGVRHFDYLPLSKLLPHAAAMVHHTGMGTMAETLRAGIPHVVMPMVNDQPDNANRLVRLGVAESLSPKAYRVTAVCSALERLLGSTEVKRRCEEVAGKFVGFDARADTCGLIEKFAKQKL